MIQMDVKKEDIESVLLFCNSLNLATICLSLDMYITQVNQASEKLFLHQQHDLINKSFHEICRELGVDAPIAPTATPETLEQYLTLTSHWLSNQRLVNVHWSIACVITEDSCVGYLLVGKVIVACFEKKPLVQMENLLRSLPCAVFSKDIAGFCLIANKYQAEMAGLLSEKEMIGKSDNDMPWCAVADTIRKADAYVIAENKTIVLEEHGTMAHGKKESFLATKSPLKDQNDKLVGIVGTAVNVTQQRKALLSYDHTSSFMHMNQEPSEIYLTRKEIECIHWMIKGKSASEIAMIVAISTRTVESHMNNIKRKLNCYKQFQLGYLIGKYGYLLL